MSIRARAGARRAAGANRPGRGKAQPLIRWMMAPRVLITTVSEGIRVPAALWAYWTISGSPAQQGTSMTTVVMDFIPACRKMALNFST